MIRVIDSEQSTAAGVGLMGHLLYLSLRATRLSVGFQQRLRVINTSFLIFIDSLPSIDIHFLVVLLASKPYMPSNYMSSLWDVPAVNSSV